MIDSLNLRTMENQIHELEKRPAVEVVANPSGSTGAHVLKKIQIGSTKYAIGGDASNIAYGDSDVDTVLDALSDSDEYTCPSTYGSYIFLKRGNVVTLRVLNPTGVASNQFTEIDAIPAKYRPKYELRFTMGATQPLGVYLRADLLVDGTFKVYNYNQETTTFVCGETFTYVV